MSANTLSPARRPRAAAAKSSSVPTPPQAAAAIEASMPRPALVTCLVPSCGWPSEADVPTRDAKTARRR